MDSKKPYVSVILPSLNVGKYIKECIESVIKQTLKNIEIICVDSGSTDETLDILEEYVQLDSRVKLIHSNVKSYGYQVNLGINYSNGEYIGIVETDDYIDEKMYETLYNATNNCNVDISKSSYYHLQDDKTFPDESKQNLPNGEFTIFDNPHIVKSHPSIWAGIYKKSFLEENNIHFMEAPGGGWVDNPFLFETALSAKKIVYTDEPFYYYRESNPESSSNNMTDFTLPMRRMLNIFEILDKYNCNDEKILATFYIRIFWHINDLINNHDFYNQEDEVLKYISEVINKLDEDIVKDYFGINEQELCHKYSLPVSAIKDNKLKSIKNINIAYILNGFPVHSETFIVNEVRWLKENGFNIIIFIEEYPYKPIEIDFDVDIIKFNSLKELEQLLIDYNIELMHTHFVFPVCTKYTFPLAEKLKIPFTVFAHAYDIFIRGNDQVNNIRGISKSKYCLGIFTLSNFHKDYLMKRGTIPEKIIITKQATNYSIQDIKIKDDPIKHIISVSRFVEKKGLDVLIKSAKILENKQFEFSIYGFGDLEFELQQLINELGCNNISIKGELQPNEVVDKLIESDLLVSPCKIAKSGDMDGFPTVIFESMGVGTPILTTNVSAIPEIIKDRNNGFIVEPDNPKVLADKICEISNLSNEELLAIRKKAQNDVKNISSVSNTMLRYVDIVSKWDFKK